MTLRQVPLRDREREREKERGRGKPLIKNQMFQDWKLYLEGISLSVDANKVDA